MSITNIRQRKLFKNGKGILLNRLLTQSSNYEDERQQIQHIRTEVSEHRDSYSSRPTLHSSHLSRQLNILENKVNRQQAITQKYFEQMECLETYFEKLMKKQNQKYEHKLIQIGDRIRKQTERNKRTMEKNKQFVQKIINKVISCNEKDLPAAYDKSEEVSINKFNFRKTETKRRTLGGDKQRTLELLQLIKFQLSKRQIEKMSSHFELFGQRSQQEETFILDIKQGQEERESQSILLDDSSIIV